jgi:predicted AlkP superfamily phosphohydrolase/phosphomutase
MFFSSPTEGLKQGLKQGLKHNSKVRSVYNKNIQEYYRYIDNENGQMLELIDNDNMTVFIVSDHGAKKEHGWRPLCQRMVDTRGISDIEVVP